MRLVLVSLRLRKLRFVTTETDTPDGGSKLARIAEHIWCYATLCPLLDEIGGHYREDAPRWSKAVTGAAQLAWFRAHNNRVYAAIVRRIA